jgi:luciferase family oxidoreductase group 1
MIPFSVLDLTPVPEGSAPADAFAHSLDLARHAERLGFHRYWLAEHHNMPGIASAATSLVIQHVAQGTRTIRVGAGGIMLPNHAPLMIAEQFGTLESLFPGRIDLGLGRAPGTDQTTAHALRRTLNGDIDNFPQDVLELMAYFAPVAEGQRVQAVPGGGLSVPIWILGSSLYGAQMAAHLGLPFGFASHFAPAHVFDAITIYRERFKPSAQSDKPYVMIGCGLYLADTDEEARTLATSHTQSFRALRSGNPGKLPAPVQGFDETLSPSEQVQFEAMRRFTVIGGPKTALETVERLITETAADEMIFSAHIYDHGARKHAYEILAGVRTQLS